MKACATGDFAVFDVSSSDKTVKILSNLCLAQAVHYLQGLFGKFVEFCYISDNLHPIYMKLGTYEPLLILKVFVQNKSKPTTEIIRNIRVAVATSLLVPGAARKILFFFKHVLEVINLISDCLLDVKKAQKPSSDNSASQHHFLKISKQSALQEENYGAFVLLLRQS